MTCIDLNVASDVLEGTVAAVQPEGQNFINTRGGKRERSRVSWFVGLRDVAAGSCTKNNRTVSSKQASNAKVNANRTRSALGVEVSTENEVMLYGDDFLWFHERIANSERCDRESAAFRLFSSPASPAPVVSRETRTCEYL